MTQRGRLKASVAKDCWAAGILAFKLCVEDGASMFLSTEADNIVKQTDLQTLPGARGRESAAASRSYQGR